MAAGAFSPAIEVRHLRYFLAVIDELHFGRAAEKLQMAQPPLSQAIRKLERELGVRLLNRTSRVVVPTAAGEAFADHARRTLRSLEEAVTAARAEDAAVRLEVRLGSSPSQPLRDVRRLLDAFRERRPDLDLRVGDLLVAEQIRRLRTGELELGLFPDVGPEDGIETERVFAGEPMAAFVSADHPLAASDVVTPADVRGETLVMIPEPMMKAEFRARYLRRLADAGYRFGRLVDAVGASPRELILPVAAGVAVSVHRASVLETTGAHGAVVRRPLDPPVILPDTVVAWSVHRSDIAGVVETARQAARDLLGAPAQEPVPAMPAIS